MTFTEHMNRVEYLSSQTLVHVQEQNYQKAREGLNNIHAYTSAAQQQLSDLEFAKAQGEIEPEAYSP